MIGAVLHNVGQIAAAIVVMQSVQVIVYFPFLLVSGCITGIFTGIAHRSCGSLSPRSIFPKENLPRKKNEQSK